MSRRLPSLSLLELYKETLISSTDCMRNILKKLLFLHERYNRELCLLLLDVDNLRSINRHHGYSTGTEILLSVADILSSSLRRSDVAGKYKGSSFLVILPETDISGAVRVVSRIRRKMSAVEVRGVRPSITIGAVSFPRDGMTTDQLLMRLEEVVAETKRTSPGSTVFAPPADIRPRTVTPLELLNAFSDDRILPAFQPVKSLATGEVFGYEVLMRVRRRDGTVVPAGEFITLLERTSKIIMFEEKVIEKALKVKVERGLKGKLFINLPALIYQFTPKSDLKIGEIYSLVLDLGVCPHDVVFEITEKQTIADVDRLSEVISLLRSLGFMIALDDFGVENSSIEKLLRIDPDFVKLNSFFLKEAKPITRWIVMSLKKAGYSIIMENVETEEDLEFVRTLKVDLVQGFHIGHPEVAEV
ncbi:MAG: EAL domain-containing protein [Aquificota bacterium]|nr:EAL domain-containing protein [Aquificota bacterium]